MGETPPSKAIWEGGSPVRCDFKFEGCGKYAVAFIPRPRVIVDGGRGYDMTPACQSCKEKMES